MKIILYNIIALAISATVVMSGCSSSNTSDNLPDMNYIDSIAINYATQYRQLVEHGSSEMQREEFLLNLNSRLDEIKREAGAIYVNEFKRVFTDSAFISH